MVGFRKGSLNSFEAKLFSEPLPQFISVTHVHMKVKSDEWEEPQLGVQV